MLPWLLVEVSWKFFLSIVDPLIVISRDDNLVLILGIGP